MAARRLKLTVSYDGTAYHGWQVQPGLPTIQGCLEDALSRIEGKAVAAVGSGRTDAGVHALAQAAACTIENPIPPGNLKKALNRLLPRDIRIMDVEAAPAEFHPRFDARSKTYEYRIWRGEVCPPFLRNYVYHFPYPLEEEALCEAAGVYVGDHDFSAFAAADERDALGGSKVRRIFESKAGREGDQIIYRVEGSGFLKHMVRLMTGALIEVGKGNLTAERLAAMLEPGNGAKQVHGAPARGLFLIAVAYD